jgi:hypothetical protein
LTGPWGEQVGKTVSVFFFGQVQKSGLMVREDPYGFRVQSDEVTVLYSSVKHLILEALQTLQAAFVLFPQKAAAENSLLTNEIPFDRIAVAPSTQHPDDLR